MKKQSFLKILLFILALGILSYINAMPFVLNLKRNNNMGAFLFSFNANHPIATTFIFMSLPIILTCWLVIRFGNAKFAFGVPLLVPFFSIFYLFRLYTGEAAIVLLIYAFRVGISWIFTYPIVLILYLYLLKNSKKQTNSVHN